jgi:hypothetical protein
MRKVMLYTVLLLIGLGFSQALPSLMGDAHDAAATVIHVCTMIGVAFIIGGPMSRHA